MARRYNGKDRTFKKTFAERYIDKIMNDGVERSTHQVVDAIITYIENQERTSSLAYVPHKGKVSHYCSTNSNYVVSRSKKGNTYQKINICTTCDGSGYKNSKPCEDCNKKEVIENDGKDE
tara:strand:- start:5716 stop:6075 length:360 start_codon:yes stop_codon:yes gene_type:complete